MSVTLYGLPSCDTCGKARQWLERAGIAYEFIDYRATPVPPETLHRWAQALGGWERLVNRAGTTWRNLLPQRKNPGTDAEWTLLLKEYPALVRRPVVVTTTGTVSVGFKSKAFEAMFAGGAAK